MLHKYKNAHMSWKIVIFHCVPVAQWLSIALAAQKVG